MSQQNTQPTDRSATATPYSLGLGAVFGVPIRVHYTFFLLLAWLVFGLPGADRFESALFVVAVFGCVVLHELGHSVVAQRYGIPVSEIVLYPIGGVARIEKQPPPREEFWIALAGPAVNVAIAGLLWLLLSVRSGVESWDLAWTPTGHYAQKLLWSNVLLVAFNLIPAFPMDGGRVLRAVLAMGMGEARATQLAAVVGQVLATGLGLLGVGLFGNPPNLIWVFIAIFVFLAAGQEAAQFRSRAYLEGVVVRDAMVTDLHTLPTGATLGQAQELLIHTTQVDFPVVNGEQVVGLLSRLDLFQGLRTEGPDGYVAGSMLRDFPVAQPNDPVQELAAAMQAAQRSCTLVMQDDRLLGMVTMENLAELLILRQIAQRTAAERA